MGNKGGISLIMWFFRRLAATTVIEEAVSLLTFKRPVGSTDILQR
jgi:hypothetical protein